MADGKFVMFFFVSNVLKTTEEDSIDANKKVNGSVLRLAEAFQDVIDEVIIKKIEPIRKSVDEHEILIGKLTAGLSNIEKFNGSIDQFLEGVGISKELNVSIGKFLERTDNIDDHEIRIDALEKSKNQSD